MNKIIEFIKKLFRQNVPLLAESNHQSKEKNISQKEDFFRNIKVDDNRNTILTLQIRLENGTIEETNLKEEQIRELKGLYYRQITNLLDSINDYRLKLSEN